MAAASTDRVVHQPVHPSMREKLDPVYLKFHDEVLQYVPTSQSQPWDPASRSAPSPFGSLGQRPVPVGRTFDRDYGDYQTRTWIPEGAPPAGGWPLLIYYHGGGWVIGGLNSENGFLTHVCKYVGCVVISINYRHAPEFVYPAAINDSYAGIKEVLSHKNVKELSLSPSRVAVAGLSAGGGLTASVTMKAALDDTITHKPIFQLLICPVIDNTANPETAWSSSQNSPWLTPGRMTWYRNHYFKNPSEILNWDASPNLAPKEVLAKSPKTRIAVAECDLLAPEDLKYGEALKEVGVQTEVEVYKGQTHSILILAGLLDTSKKLIHDSCAALAENLGTSYNPEKATIVS